MKLKIILLFSVLLDIAWAQQNPNGWDTAWVNSYGGVGIDIGRDIKETKDHGLIIAGSTSSFGNSNSSFYVIKTDSLGQHQWSKSYSQGNNSVAYSEEIASDGYFFCGISNWNIQNGYDGYVVKTDTVGNLLWTKNYGGSDWDFIYNSCVLPDGGLILCGETYSGSNGGADAYIIRINSSGDTVWTRKIGSSGDDSFYSVKFSNNRIYAVGKTYIPAKGKSAASINKFDLNGVLIKQDLFLDTTEDRVYYDLCISNSGGLLLCGKRTISSNNYHYIVRKTDSTNFGELYYITSPDLTYFRSVLEGNNGDVYTLGPTIGLGNGGLSAFVFRISSTFHYQSSANFGGPQDEDGNKLIRTSRGYAFVGWTTSYGNQTGSTSENVYSVIFNKKDLVNDYYLLINQFQDDVGLRENKRSSFSNVAYPNPTSTFTNIKFEDQSLNGEILQCELYDSQGTLVSGCKLKVTDSSLLLNMHGMTPGLYSYRIRSNTTFIGTGKITVE